MSELICISTDTTEELIELKKILSDIKKKHIVYNQKKSGKIRETIEFIKFLKTNKIKSVIGSPCIRNRAANLLGVKYTSYLRSLHPSPEVSSSRSDEIYFTFKKFGFNQKIFNPYTATECIITSAVTEKFLIHRGIEKSKIKNIGACWLPEKGTKFHKNPENLICFITQAFSKHLNEKAQAEQLEAIKETLRIATKNGMKLIIRKHPRDEYDYESHFKKDNKIISINSDTPTDFIKNFNPNTIIISSFSTLAFELLSCEAKAIFINLDSTPSYRNIFSNIGITPRDWKNIDLREVTQQKLKIFDTYDIEKTIKTLENL